MAQLSVVIITLNEESRIGRCIDSVRDFADEILVIDSFSTDKTEEICRQKGARFIRNKFEGYIQQKNFASDQAKYSFVFAIDADEVVSEELRSSILAIKENPQFEGYTMNRLNNYCGKWIRHSGWYPDRKLRLFDRTKGKWGGMNPHDKLEMAPGSRVGHLRGDLYHYSFNTIHDHIQQINNFSTIGARSYFEIGKKAPLLVVVFSPILRLIRDYIILGGFLDGYYGFVVCIISSHYTFLKYVKLRQLHRKSGRNDPRRYKTIILSRTDNIGDVVLALPMAGVIKEAYPDSRILFFGKAYTKPVIDLSSNIDGFIDWSEVEKLPVGRQVEFLKALKADALIHVFPKNDIAKLAWKARIPLRIGTRNRHYHWWTCNRLNWMTRKRSSLHEAQLNLKLLKMIGIKQDFALHEIPRYFGLSHLPEMSEKVRQLAETDKYLVILHPKSRGSAREWGLDNFSRLIGLLSPDRFRIIISGTNAEGEIIRKEGFFDRHPGVLDITGQLILEEFISLIKNADALIACSTGPLHLAAALGRNAIGIYPPMRPIHPGRWAPLGPKANFLVLDKECSKCRYSGDCECVKSISPESVKEKLMECLRFPISQL
jgi:heptosyltransferase-3